MIHKQNKNTQGDTLQVVETEKPPDDVKVHVLPMDDSETQDDIVTSVTVPEETESGVTVAEQAEMSEDSHDIKDGGININSGDVQDASVCSSETDTVNVAKADAVQLVQSDESFKSENIVMSDVVLSVDDDPKTAQCTVQFADEADVCKDTSSNLDDTLDISEKIDDEESGKHVLGSEVPLCNQDSFQCTPPCSQIPQVDPYSRKRKSHR